MKLDVKAFAMACGLIWGIGLLLITWWIILWDGPNHDVTMIGRVYRGYEITWLGSFIGAGWALVDGVIGGAIFAWLYNALVRKPTAHAPG